MQAVLSVYWVKQNFHVTFQINFLAKMDENWRHDFWNEITSNNGFPFSINIIIFKFQWMGCFTKFLLVFCRLKFGQKTHFKIFCRKPNAFTEKRKKKKSCDFLMFVQDYCLYSNLRRISISVLQNWCQFLLFISKTHPGFCTVLVKEKLYICAIN